MHFYRSTLHAVIASSLVACGGATAANIPSLQPGGSGAPTSNGGATGRGEPTGGGDGVVAPPPSTQDDARAAALLDATFAALVSSRDEASAARAAIPYLHKSLLDSTGADLSADTRTFSFKKAFAAASGYASPVKITRVRPGKVTAIGFGPTGEKGRTVDYFVAKRDGVAGMPAPITVFFPDSGAPPKVSYLGSL